MNAFSVWVGLGASVGLWRVARSAPQRQVGLWVNAGLFVLFFTLVGARVFYVGIDWSYFSAHLIEAPELWLGGLTWPGALAGAGLAFLILGFRYRTARSQTKQAGKIPLGWLGDRLYPLLPPLVVTAWLGCWQSGVAYGALAPKGALWGVPTLDEAGFTSLRFPLQPLAALTLLIFFWLLETRARPLRPAGKLSGLAVAGLLLNLLAASLLRADTSLSWNGLRLDTWFAIFYLLFFGILLLINNVVRPFVRRTVLRAGRKSLFSSPERSSN